MSNYTVSDINYQKSFDFENVYSLVNEEQITLMSLECKGKLIASFPAKNFYILRKEETNDQDTSTHTMD
jgi:hypothetical protein